MQSPVLWGCGAELQACSVLALWRQGCLLVWAVLLAWVTGVCAVVGIKGLCVLGWWWAVCADTGHGWGTS